MNRFIPLTLLLLLICQKDLQAQNEVISFEIITSPGDSLREAGDMYGAIAAYRASIAGGNTFPPGDRSVERSVYSVGLYNLACALSRAGQQDSAIQYLKRAIMEFPDGSSAALSDPDLIGLRKTAGWPALESIIIQNYCDSNNITIRDLAYAKALWYMRAVDQAYYKDIEIAEAKTGKTSTVVLALWDLKRRLNEENQRQLEELIEEKGWPKISMVGSGPASAAFLVIQHADMEKQQKYLPVIERLCKAGEARWQDYALMYDRLQTSLGKPQRYGSQVTYNRTTQRYELSPLEDATRVEQWRKEVGLQPLAQYLKNWDIEWP